MIALAVLSAFALVIIYGGVRDVMSFTIPNWVSVAAAVLFLPAALAVDLPLGAVGLHLATGLGVLVLGMGLYAVNGIGGGDAKLLAAVALWMGWPDLTAYLAVGAILGGVFALVLLLARRALGPVAQGYGVSIPILERSEAIPYGVAIAGGALIYLPRSQLGSALIGVVA